MMEEPIGIPRRPERNRQARKKIEPDFTDSERGAGMKGVLKHYGLDVEAGEIEVHFPDTQPDPGTFSTERDPREALVDIIPKDPGLIPEEDYKGSKRALPLSPLDVRELDEKFFHGRSMEPPAGFLAADRPQYPVDVSEHQVDSESRESGIRVKASADGIKDVIEITPESALGGARGYVKEKVNGDESRAPFKASIIEKEDETIAQWLKKKITGKSKKDKAA